MSKILWDSQGKKEWLDELDDIDIIKKYVEYSEAEGDPTPDLNYLLDLYDHHRDPNALPVPVDEMRETAL